jgi:SAM-dependent methyltransferase
MNWTPEKISQKCYNDVYVQYDPDFISPNGGRTNMMFNYVSQKYNKNIFHLDYGSGEGFLTKRLNEIGYMNSYCYDPFHHPNKEILNKKFDLITCVEVVEHSYNINEVFKLFYDLLNPNGELIITTLFRNQELLDDWWYCAPRVGHILFFEEKGFRQFASKHNFFLESIKPFQSQKIIKLRKK